MNVQQIIADLEKRAAQYTEAANTLRALLPNQEPAQDGARGKAAATQQSGKKAKGGTGTKMGKTKTGQAGKKRTVSPETREKMAAAARARFQKRNQEAQ